MLDGFKSEDLREKGKLALIGYGLIFIVGAVFIYFIASAIMNIFISFTGFVFPDGYEQSDMFLALNNFLLYVVLTIFVLYIYNKIFANQIKETFSNGEKITHFIALVFVAFIISMVVNYVSSLILEYLNVGESNNQAALRPLVVNYAYLMIPATVIGAPIVEEFIFRKAIFDVIPNQIIAFIVSSFSFGLIHVLSSLLVGDFGDLYNIIVYGAMGAVFSGLYVVSKKNIVYPIALHAAQNLLACLAIIYFVK